MHLGKMIMWAWLYICSLMKSFEVSESCEGVQGFLSYRFMLFKNFNKFHFVYKILKVLTGPQICVPTTTVKIEDNSGTKDFCLFVTNTIPHAPFLKTTDLYSVPIVLLFSERQAKPRRTCCLSLSKTHFGFIHLVRINGSFLFVS